MRAIGRRLATACQLPIIAKLTPNVTSIADIARAAEQGGADSISLINTCQGMAVDWRRRRPLLGNVLGGLSGPAIKPIALRAVYQVAQAVKTPLIGIGGIATLDDVMEFLVTGASAVQLGTVNFLRSDGFDAHPRRLARRDRTITGHDAADIVGTLQAGPIAKIDHHRRGRSGQISRAVPGGHTDRETTDSGSAAGGWLRYWPWP